MHFFVYLLIIAFMSSAVHVPSAFAKKINEEIVYDLLDDSIDYEWIKGEDKIVYHLKFVMDSRLKDFLRVVKKRVIKKKLQKVKKALHKRIIKHNSGVEEEIKAIYASDNLSDKKKKKLRENVCEKYVDQVKSDLLKIKSENDDEVAEYMDKMFAQFHSAKKDKKRADIKKVAFTALKITGITVGALLLVAGTATAIAGTVVSGGTTAVVGLGIGAAAIGFIAGAASGIVATYSEIKTKHDALVNAEDQLTEGFEDFEKYVDSLKVPKTKGLFTLKNQKVKKWRSNILKSRRNLSKLLDNYSSEVVSQVKLYSKVDQKIDQLEKKVSDLETKKGTKAAKRVKTMKAKLAKLERVSDEDLEELRQTVKLSSKIRASLNTINKKLDPPELRKKSKKAVANIGAAIRKYDSYSSEQASELAKTANDAQTVADAANDLSKG